MPRAITHVHLHFWLPARARRSPPSLALGCVAATSTISSSSSDTRPLSVHGHCMGSSTLDSDGPSSSAASSRPIPLRVLGRPATGPGRGPSRMNPAARPAGGGGGGPSRFQSRYGGGGPSRAQTVFDPHEESAGLLDDDEGDEGRELEPGLSLGGAQDGSGSANGVRKVRDDPSDCLCTRADDVSSLRSDASRRPRPFPPRAASGPSRLRQQAFLDQFPSSGQVSRPQLSNCTWQLLCLTSFIRPCRFAEEEESVPSQYRSQSEVQLCDIRASRPIRAVQILLQSLLPTGCTVAVHPGSQDRSVSPAL